MVSIVVIITAYNTAGLSPGLSALGTSFLSFFSGAGLRGSLYGTRGQKFAGGSAAIIFMAIAHWIGAGVWVHIYGIDLAGSEWGWIGFFICLLFMPKRMAAIYPSVNVP